MTATSTLGDLLALGRSTNLRGWLDVQEPALVERLQAEAQARGETIAQFLRIATADFLAEADHEVWASLISELRDNADPGAVCVARVMAFRLELERPERTP
jgi:hypothetical protein